MCSPNPKGKGDRFYIENGQHVLNKISQTIFTDFLFLAAVAMGKSDNTKYDGGIARKFKTMLINTLRRKNCDKGLGTYQWD